jgi:phenylalanyl-tRNA synthetase beta chain
MTISYKWLCEYLPEQVELQKLGKLLTSVGLEVESITPYEELKGNLQGVVVGEVITCDKHPDADKLKLTTVNIGSDEPLQIVCGAPNVAVGQKVLVATVGTTIYPTNGEPLTMKKAKIRGVESFGMICAEDELGLGESHAGIMILPNETEVGVAAAAVLGIYSDYIIEIGLTPNHMDAQSHIGVAREVVAYLNHHNKSNATVKTPYGKALKIDNQGLQPTITVDENTKCKRYSGVVIENVTVAPSPKWLQSKLKAIGLRPINNIVDITNYILHETGQPLHAFDNDIVNGTVHVKCANEGNIFVTLDEKERKLSAEDVMIYNASEPMCIGGVFGGLHSGVTDKTTAIFLETAVFDATAIRKSSIRHGLRTDAALRFEKGVDISNTVNVLKRAALLIQEIAGGNMASDVVDIYPAPAEKTAVSIKYHYLKKLSGKNYHPETVKAILQNLGFEIAKDAIDELTVLVPFYKTDINLPADLVEEIMRIDGLDNIDIPKNISIAPGKAPNSNADVMKERIANQLVGLGFKEVFTNSITHSALVPEADRATMVRMINNLSTELDVMRTNMIQTGMASVAYNINRKQNNLRFFEFGRTYATSGAGEYTETEHLAIYITGNKVSQQWNAKATPVDIYYAKAIAEHVLNSCAVAYNVKIQNGVATYEAAGKALAIVQQIPAAICRLYDVKAAVYSIDILWEEIIRQSFKVKHSYKEISKFPAVERDIAMVLDKNTTYQQIEQTIRKAGVKKLQQIKLFDVFESEKLGIGKKSMAVNLTFVDNEKTLTDKETESFVKKILANLQQELHATLR